MGLLKEYRRWEGDSTGRGHMGHMGEREVQERGDIRIIMIDSHCCMAESNTIL